MLCILPCRRLADVISSFCLRLSLISLISSTFCFHSALLTAVSFAHASTKKMQQGSDCAMTTLVCVAKSVMQYQCPCYSSQGVRIRTCAKGTNSPSAEPRRDGGKTRGRCGTMEKHRSERFLALLPSGRLHSARPFCLLSSLFSLLSSLLSLLSSLFSLLSSLFSLLLAVVVLRGLDPMSRVIHSIHFLTIPGPAECAKRLNSPGHGPIGVLDLS